MGSSDFYSAYVTHRPRRVAFLVDLGAEDVDHVLDAIADFNTNSWGGRHNAIIPLQGSAVHPNYWKLLRLADPDIVYSFGELDAPTIGRLDSELDPTFVKKNGPASAGDAITRRDLLFLDLHHQPSIARHVIKKQKLFPYYLRPACGFSLFALDADTRARVSPFVRRSIGAPSAAYQLDRDFHFPVSCPRTPSDVHVIECISQSEYIELPINACESQQPPHYADARVPDGQLLICIGDSPWNFVHFWNSAHFRRPRHLLYHWIGELWLPASYLSDESLHLPLAHLLCSRAAMHGQTRRIAIVSFDYDHSVLHPFAQALQAKLPGGFQLEEPIRHEPGYVADFAVRGSGSSRDVDRTHHYVSGERLFLKITPPQEVDTNLDQAWMLDLKIDDPKQTLATSHPSPWWRLPRKPLVAGGFRSGAPIRIVESGELSTEVSSKVSDLEIVIPEKIEIFTRLLVPRIGFTDVWDLRRRLNVRTMHSDIGISDKGRYLSGIVRLFPNLPYATSFFEHPFWGSLLEQLCSPTLSDHIRKKVSKDVTKQTDELNERFSSDPSRAREWLTELVLTAARGIPLGSESITLEDIETLPRRLAPGEAAESIKQSLTGLLQMGVFLMGAEIQCPRCISTFWYHVDDLKTRIRCRGCHTLVRVEAEPRWAYKPNELVRQGFRHHGVLPVIRVLNRLLRGCGAKWRGFARQDFLYLPGVTLWGAVSPKNKPLAEIDLCWVSDGRFGIAEIKTSTKKFGSVDYDRLIRVANEVSPDIVLLAATNGDDSDIDVGRARLTDALGPPVEVLGWGPAYFADAPLM